MKEEEELCRWHEVYNLGGRGLTEIDTGWNSISL